MDEPKGCFSHMLKSKERLKTETAFMEQFIIRKINVQLLYRNKIFRP